MKERTQLILKLVTSHILLIPVLIAVQAFLPWDGYLMIPVVQILIIIVFLTGYWEFFGFRFRFYYTLAMEFILIVSTLMKIRSSNNAGVNIIIAIILSLILLVLIIQLIKILIVRLRSEMSGVEIHFPFGKGDYLITDGGNSRISRLMNYHYYSFIHRKNKTNNSMLYATDIVKLSTDEKKFLPPHNADYQIFEENIYSPVSGVIVKAENCIEDNIPYSGGYPYNTGNTIVIKNENLYMLLGHLKKGSLLVNPGQHVTAGDHIAAAGNSGYSERPHLHMQLIRSNSDNYWQGMGVAILFSKRNMYKNRLIGLK